MVHLWKFLCRARPIHDRRSNLGEMVCLPAAYLAQGCSGQRRVLTLGAFPGSRRPRGGSDLCDQCLHDDSGDAVSLHTALPAMIVDRMRQRSSFWEGWTETPNTKHQASKKSQAPIFKTRPASAAVEQTA